MARIISVIVGTLIFVTFQNCNRAQFSAGQDSVTTQGSVSYPSNQQQQQPPNGQTPSPQSMPPPVQIVDPGPTVNCPDQVMRYDFGPPAYPVPGHCEGMVYFAPKEVPNRYMSYSDELGMQYSSRPTEPNSTAWIVSTAKVNGSTDVTWLEEGSAPNIVLRNIRSPIAHNGITYLSTGGTLAGGCSIYALCENGVATAKGMSW